MKYTIEGLQQGVLLDLAYQEYNKKKKQKIIKHPIDISDAVILRFVIDFYSTGKMTEIQINGKTYFWVNYKTVIKELPLLKIKEMHGIANRFRKYEKVGLLKKEIVYEKEGQKGTFTFFRFTEKLADLLFTPETKSSDPCNDNFIPPETQDSPPPETKSSDKDSSTIINSSTREKDCFSIPLEFYRQYNDITFQFARPTEIDNKKAHDFCKKSDNQEKTIKQVLTAVQYYFSEEWWFTFDKKTKKPCYSFGGFIANVGEIITWMNKKKNKTDNNKKCGICRRQYVYSVEAGICDDCYREQIRKEGQI